VYALTIKQPWAELIIRGRKDVENRVWRTKHRGMLAVHAGEGFDAHEPAVRGPFEHGAIIGVVDVVACRKRSGSPWGLGGQWHWVLERPRRLTQPIECKGKQGLWTVDRGIEQRIHERLRGVRVAQSRNEEVVRRAPVSKKLSKRAETSPRQALKGEMAGFLAVDSGQVMVVDPAHVKHWGGDALPTSTRKRRPTQTFDYQGAVTATSSKEGYGMLGPGLAVVVGTTYGDGDYPVYAMRDRRGDVVRLVVELSESLEL
jgi:ASCH domain/Protein of unknown function (DUF4241)